MNSEKRQKFGKEAEIRKKEKKSEKRQIFGNETEIWKI